MECSEGKLWRSKQIQDKKFYRKLYKSRKGTMSIDQYLNKVKFLANNLEIDGKTIHHLDLVTQVLVGLDEEYTPIVV